jgi:preprotein translocase subunit YajC
MDQILSSPLLPIGAVMVVMYFLLFRPQQQRMKQLKLAVDNVRRGDTVVTAGGIIGKVVKVKDEGELLVEIADNVQVRILKGTISEVRAKATADAKADKD